MRTHSERQLKNVLGSLSADVSHVAELQEELSKSEEKYRTILEEMDEGYYEIDASGNLTFLNEATARMYGCTRREMLGMSYKVFTPSDQWAATVADYVRVFTTGIPQRRRAGVGLRKDGTIGYREDSIFPIRNDRGEVTGLRGIARDISERKKAEEALQKSEAQYRLLSEHTTDGILLLDMNLKIMYVSPSVEKIRGFTLLEAIKMPLEKHVTPESLKLASELFLEDIPRVEADPDYNPVRILELEYYCKDGTTIWTESKFSVIRDPGGKPVSILGESRDISERKKAEEALQKTENTYRLLAEHIHDLVWMMDMDLNITWLSPSSAKTRGFSLDEIAALPLDRQLTPESLGKVARLFEKLVRIEAEGSNSVSDVPLSVALEFYCKGGHTLWFDCTFQVIRDEQGKAKGILAEARDITERRAAERAREESEKSYRLLAENTSDVVTMMDMDLNITWLSSSCEKLTGFSYEEQKLNPFDKQMTPETLQKALEQFAIALEDEKKGTADPDRHQDIELEIYHKDGHTIWTENRLRFIRDGQGKPVGMLMQGRDITARKQAEEALHKTLEDLKRSNAELEQFAYVASHDLQEPLRMVSSYVQLLEKRYKDKLDPDAHDFISYAVSGARRMQNLINDLLSYSRVGTRGKPFQTVDCSEVLYAAMSNLEVAIRESDAVIDHSDMPQVFGDEAQLIQVFQNVIGNAVKFHGEEPPHIRVDAVLKDGEWVFSVKDNGIGIDPQYFERIFLVFQRLHGNEYPGTGIGLSVARKIVERHGGRIWLKSDPGRGSTFYFTVPVREGE